jgi:GntR family transcriptional regulator
MFLSIDVHSDVAIYLQICLQVKFAVAAGTLQPGQLLPSARVLSGKLAINPNTVARAFTQLQSDGVIESLRGRGMVVCDGAGKLCRKEREQVLGERIGNALAEAWNAGLDASKIQSIIDAEIKRLEKTTPRVHAPPSDNGPVKAESST